MGGEGKGKGRLCSVLGEEGAGGSSFCSGSQRAAGARWPCAGFCWQSADPIICNVTLGGFCLSHREEP